MINKRDIAIINDPVLATYIAKELGTVNVNNILCPQDETLFSAYGTMIFKKGNPLLDKFNIPMFDIWKPVSWKNSGQN